MTKKLTMWAALLAAVMFVPQAVARDQADASGTGQANDNADVAAPSDSDASGSAGAADASGATDAAGQSSTDNAQPAAGRQGQAGQQGSQSGQIGEKDRRFVMKAASSGLFEVASSKLAAQQAQSEEVKRFAQQMVEDHQRANKQLMQIAQRKGIQVPQDMLPVHKACLQELQQYKGRDFERAYLIDQVAEHNKAVLKFRDASTELQDQELKQFASQTLPKLREHLAHVEQIAGVDQESTAGSREHGSDQSGQSGQSGTSDQPGTSTPAGGDRESGGAGAGSEQTPGAIGGESDSGAGAGAGNGAGTGAGAGSDAGSTAEESQTDRNAR